MRRGPGEGGDRLRAALGDPVGRRAYGGLESLLRTLRVAERVSRQAHKHPQRRARKSWLIGTGPLHRFQMGHGHLDGLRVLPLGDGVTADARRETVFSIGTGGMLSVAGGKLTTYRRIALAALEHVRGPLDLRRIDRHPFPLPGARGGASPLPVELDPDVEAHLRHLYGSRAAAVAELGALDPSLLERVHPGGPDIAAQAVFAIADEWAETAEDILRRRTTVALRGLADASAVARVDALLARL